jgi:hypothetical protein
MDKTNELYHYGVKGMKWGIRRYQNENGTLTSAGKKRAKQEYKEDNKTAYELGKTATIYGHAAARSLNRTTKLENKLHKQYAKDPNVSSRRTQSLKNKWEASYETTMDLGEKYKKLHDNAKSHCNYLIKKYGKEAVSEIKYTEKKLQKGEHSLKSVKTMNERTNNMSDYAAAGIASLGTSAMLAVMGAPYAVLIAPSSTRSKAADLERATYRQKRG